MHARRRTQPVERRRQLLLRGRLKVAPRGGVVLVAVQPADVHVAKVELRAGTARRKGLSEMDCWRRLRQESIVRQPRDKGKPAECALLLRCRHAAASAAPTAARPLPLTPHLCVGVSQPGSRPELAGRPPQVPVHALPSQHAVAQLAVRLHVAPGSRGRATGRQGVRDQEAKEGAAQTADSRQQGGTCQHPNAEAPPLACAPPSCCPPSLSPEPSSPHAPSPLRQVLLKVQRVGVLPPRPSRLIGSVHPAPAQRAAAVGAEARQGHAGGGAWCRVGMRTRQPGTTLLAPARVSAPTACLTSKPCPPSSRPSPAPAVDADPWLRGARPTH